MDRDTRIGDLDRRSFLKRASAVGAAAMLPVGAMRARAEEAPVKMGAASTIELARFPEKTDLILLTDRPPQLETPLKYFKTDLTPNDAMFVRWHLAGIPTSVDLETFRLQVGGHVEKPLSLSMADLKKYEQHSTVAVNQCSGNSRSFFSPRVPGGQWQNGAMGNAEWTGVRLKDLLADAGAKAGAVQVSFQGLDRPILPMTPAFMKALDFDKATEENVLVAYAMNGKPLPMLNGFPLRLIVPGWFATYWVKALNDINVLDAKLKSFWMDKAYRVPNNPESAESPTDLAKDTVPISKMPVRSIFATEPGAAFPAGASPARVQGVAFDGGSGIAKVETSIDGGATWTPASLGADLGDYSWRCWQYDLPQKKGRYSVKARATSKSGEVQPAARKWNRSGYSANWIETLEVTVA